MADPGNGMVLISNPNENEGPYIIGATLAITILALITVATRVYIRTLIIHSFGWDDALMTLAIVISIAGQAFIIPEVYCGAGRHIGDVDPAVYSRGLKLNFITQPIYLFDICVVKLAVGASLLRISPIRFYKYTIVSVMILMTFYTIGCFFTILFQCTDIRVLWDPTVKATCWSQGTLQALSYTNSVLNIFTDLLFAVAIPAPMLWRLNMNLRTRLSLIAVLGLGVFACAAAAVKISYLVDYGKLGDWLWDSRNITIWTVVECNTGIIAGSLPSIRPLLKRVLGSMYGRGSRRSGEDADTPKYYGRSTTKSGKSNKSGKSSKSNTSKQWQTLSSAGGSAAADETSSQRAFNRGVDDFELGDVLTGSGAKGQKRIVVVEVDKSSDDDDEDGAVRRAGITKTTTTTMTFTDLKASP